MDAPPESRMVDYDVIPWALIAAILAAQLLLVGSVLGGLSGLLPHTAMWVGFAVVGTFGVGLLAWWLPADWARADTAPAEILHEHARLHQQLPRRRQLLVSVLSRLRCRSGWGHCVHPRGDEPRTDVVFHDDGVEHVDRGGWCCHCPARWMFTPLTIPACRMCL